MAVGGKTARNGARPGGRGEISGFDAHAWASFAVAAPSIEVALREAATRLRPYGFTSIAVLFDMPLVAAPPFPAKSSRFGVCISESWERVLEMSPAMVRDEPMARRFSRSPRPLYLWRGCPLALSLSPSEAHYLDYYEEHGMRSGAAFPVHDRAAGTASILFLNDADPRRCVPDLARSGEGDAIHLAFTHFCEGLRVRHLAERLPRPLLSPRERECLAWAAAGYTTQSIADRLSLADSTVNEYFAGAARKLECATRAQACARAALLSLIQP